VPHAGPTSTDPRRVAPSAGDGRRTMTGRPGSGFFGAVIGPLQAFLRLEAASGIVLMLAAAIALVWANVHPASYRTAIDAPLTIGAGGTAIVFTVGTLINDGLMTLFFFLVGMEIKRELAVGELNSIAKASLPAVAALGGMLLPAAIFLAFTWGRPEQRGWGIPMATDIAFCVGVLTLLKDRVPRALVVFITALAIFDDIGGILVIAFFYGSRLNVPWLLGAGGLCLCLFGLNRAAIRNGFAYGASGAALWFALHQGGIHPTIAGVALGLSIPVLPRRRVQAPLHKFEHLLHPYVAFFIMPLFALANSGVSLRSGLSALDAPVTLGAAVGLFAGKQLGIFALTVLAVKLRLAPMPGNASLAKLFGVSIVAGIGFTVALFIAALAYADSPALLDQAKTGILIGSLAAGLLGFVVLRGASSPPGRG